MRLLYLARAAGATMYDGRGSMALSPRQLTALVSVVLFGGVAARVARDPHVFPPSLDPASSVLLPPLAVEEGTEGRFLLHHAAVIPCRTPNREACTKIVAVDVDSGELVMPRELVFADGDAATKGFRARALAGEVVVVGSIVRQSQLDETEGRPFTFDAGGLRPGHDTVLRGREVAPLPEPARLARLPRALAVLGCELWRDDEIGAIKLDADHAYVWACNQIVRLDKEGASSPDVVADTTSNDMGHFAVTEREVFWTNGAQLWRRETAGGAVIPLGAQDPARCAGSWGAFAADGEGVYCCDQSREPRPGPTCVLTLYVSNGFRAWLGIFGRVDDLVVDGGALYLTNTDYASEGPESSILRLPAGGGPVTTLLKRRTGSEFGGGASLTIAGDEIYWRTSSPEAAIASMPKNGGSIVVRSGTRGTMPTSLAVAGDDLFWTTQDHRAFHVPRRATDQIFRRGGASNTLRVAADAKYLYTITSLSGTTPAMTLLRRPH
jgi:hypothetical protein